MSTHLFLVLLFAVFMLPGIPAVFVPFIPGIPYMFLMALLFEVFDRFHTLSVKELGVLFLIPVIAFIIDWSFGILASKYGGGKAPFWYGLLGALVGLFAFPPFGGLLGLFCGVLLGELIHDRDASQAMRAASSGLIGSFTGMIINSALAISFIILFIIFAH